MIRVQRPLPVFPDRVHRTHFLQILVIPHLDLLDLMRGAESIKEVKKRNSSLDGGQMCHGSQIHYFLYIAGTQHGKSGLAAGIYIRVIAKDRKGMARQRPGGYMDHRRQKFSCHFIHIRNHQ